MPQTAIDVSSFLVRGTQYTFSLSPSGAVSLVYRPALSDVIAALEGAPGTDQLGVTVAAASFFSINSDQFNVTFVYAGDGSDTVASMQAELIGALAGLSTSFDFVAAYAGASGTPADTTGLPDLSAAGLSGLLGSSSSLWAIALIGLLVVFLMSGGAGIVKRVAA